jgi:hypothetical protein
MATAFVDSLQGCKSLFSGAYASANADNIAPKFIIIDDDADLNSQKRYDAGMGDCVFITLTSRTNTPAGIGVVAKEVRDLVQLDVRTGQGRAHHMKVLGELDRIMDLNILNPINGFGLEMPGSWQDFSIRLARIWRHTLDLEYINYSLPRGS